MITTTEPAGVTGSANTHARLSPSDSKRWTSCLASIAFQEANAHRVRKDNGSSYSDAGTEAHEHAANVLMGECTIDDVPEIGSYGDDLRIHVKAYVDHCMAQVDGAKLSSIKECHDEAEAAELIGVDPEPPDRVYFVEEQIPLFYQEEQTGTADFIGIVAKDRVVSRFIGRDLKFGAGVLVNSTESTQLAIYIYSAIKRLEGIYAFGPETMVDLAVFQPRHREGAEQQPWVLTLADLATFCQEIEYAAIRAREGANRVRLKLTDCDEGHIQRGLRALDAVKHCQDKMKHIHMRENDKWMREHPPVEWTQRRVWLAERTEKWVNENLDPGDVSQALHVSPEEILEAAPGLRFHPEEGDGGSCRWCKTKAFCGKRLAALTEDMDTPHLNAEDLLAMMPDLEKQESKLPVEDRVNLTAERLGLTSLGDDYLVTLFKRSKGIKKFLDDISEYLEGRLLDGDEVDGVQLVMGREGNRAWANEEAADTFLRNQGLKQGDRYDMKLKSPTAIEKALAPKLKTVKRTANRFNELVTRSPAKRVIALADDKRPAVASAIAEMPDLEEPVFE